MATLRELKNRVRSIKNIQKITKAMMLVAAAKLKKLESQLKPVRLYSESIKEIMADFALRDRQIQHPYLEKRIIRKKAIVVLTSQRGLCGSFNSNVIRFVNDLIETSKHPFCLILIGKKGINFYKRLNHEIKAQFDMPERLKKEEIDVITNFLHEVFILEEVDEISVVYTKFLTPIKRKVLEEKILPVDPRDSKKIGINEYIYEPNPAEILHEIAPKYLKSQVFRLLCESQVSEQAERMNAMNLATTNAGRLLDELTLTYNKLRQAAITSEVSEIVTTVNALKGQ